MIQYNYGNFQVEVHNPLVYCTSFLWYKISWVILPTKITQLEYPFHVYDIYSYSSTCTNFQCKEIFTIQVFDVL